MAAKNLSGTVEHFEWFEGAVKELVDGGSVVECEEPPTLVSAVNVVPKSTPGKYRFTHDLRGLNLHLRRRRFRLETLDLIGSSSTRRELRGILKTFEGLLAHGELRRGQRVLFYTDYLCSAFGCSARRRQRTTTTSWCVRSTSWRRRRGATCASCGFRAKRTSGRMR